MMHQKERGVSLLLTVTVVDIGEVSPFIPLPVALEVYMYVLVGS